MNTRKLVEIIGWLAIAVAVLSALAFVLAVMK